MNKKDLLNHIRQEFKDVILGDSYTLVEEDYADTAYWHFDKEHIDSNLTSEEWNAKEINFLKTSNLFQEDIEEAIRSILEKRKMSNRFLNPLEIPPTYLDKYFTGFSYLKPEGYIFYTPSMMLYVLENSEEALRWNGFTWWLFRLNRNDSNRVFKCLTKNQLNILTEFLKYLIGLNTINKFDKGEDIRAVLKKIQSFKSE
ncbi:hypothetical protein GCM10027155_09370 [Acinetobacter apis]|uniref:Uncharacterized protein n=1 Tax=Acinetobacter apis TaxID=1229165 RepID=A0A217EFQ6_9GAMM|nr:DUF6714 family protein [Acinetobacter apis]SNQ29016.1 hypothetical protein SAMN05444584_0947 [Acinetobacter apis]